MPTPTTEKKDPKAEEKKDRHDAPAAIAARAGGAVVAGGEPAKHAASKKEQSDDALLEYIMVYDRYMNYASDRQKGFTPVNPLLYEHLQKAYTAAKKTLAQTPKKLALLEKKHKQVQDMAHSLGEIVLFKSKQERQNAINLLLAYIDTTKDDKTSRYRLAEIILNPATYSSKHRKTYAQELRDIIEAHFSSGEQAAWQKLYDYRETGDSTTASAYGLGVRSYGDKTYLEDTYHARWRTVPE